jgi:hypothetical protein
MRFFLTAIGLFLFGTGHVLFGTTQAFAADDAFCQYYASQAVQTVATAEDESSSLLLAEAFGMSYFGLLDTHYPLLAGCGLSGPRYSPSSDDHYNWCRGQDEATVNAEQAARRRETQYCAVCVSYVNVASALEDSGRAAHCSLRGTNWPSDANGLLQFCLARDHSDFWAAVDWFTNNLKAGRDKINACKAFLSQKVTPVIRDPLRNVKLRNDLTKDLNDGTVDKGNGKGSVLGRTPGLDDPHCLRCKSKGPNVAAPGLLESDQAFSPQGPAPTGPVAPRMRSE